MKSLPIILSLLLLFFFLPMFNREVFASTIFEDDFNSYSNGSFPSSKWVKYSPPPIPGCSANWQVQGGEFGVSIPPQGGCADNMIPIISEWPTPLNQYIFEVDMRFVSGTDHNLPYIIEPSTLIIYEIHFQSPGDFTLGGPIDAAIVNVPQGYPNGSTYHIKTVVNVDKVKVFINNVLVREVHLSTPLPLGTIGLRAGVGGDPSSETWFDNVIVSTLDENLDVPLLKQTNPSWGNQTYDSANVWSPSSPGISSWGCALTSAAMVFQYHGIKKLPNNRTLDPGTLNDWLISQPDGYVRNGLVNWLALSRLSRLAENKNSGFLSDALEYRRKNGSDNSQLESDIRNGIPGILEEPGHFIVGKGFNPSTFLINDPFYDHTDLSSYGNTFQSLGRYIPSNTDLSYIMLVIDQNVDISLKDSSNNLVGESFIQAPLEEDGGDGISGVPVKILYYPKPQDGGYTINVSSSSVHAYALNIYLYDALGNPSIQNETGSVGPGDPDSIPIHFEGSNNAVTFDTLINDINELRNSDDIYNFGVYISLISKAEGAKLLAFLNKNTAKNILNSMLNELNAQKGKHINETAFNLLNNDIQALILQLGS